jgi:mutator protein MutT
MTKAWSVSSKKGSGSVAEDCVIPCGVALIRRGRQFLISQRCKDDTFGSKWEFPGGKKEPGETFEECVAREVKEETGVEVQVHQKFMEVRRRYHERVIWLNFYLCSYLSGEPRPVDCAQVLWADIDELKKYDFPPANDAVIQKLKETSFAEI